MKQKRQNQPTLRRTVAAVSIIAGLGGLTSALAEKEWWDETPYYEEDGWLDVSEWFDGNDYHLTDEAFRWDDEVNDNGEDTATDVDRDRSADENWDYDYESSAASGDRESADRDTGNTATKNQNSATGHGFDTRYEADNWFYDFWDDGYTSYRDADRDGKYEFSSTYFDTDGDGLYDGYYSYYDEDGDGTYDRLNYWAFNEWGSKNQHDKNTKPSARSGKRQQTGGEVTNLKKVSVRDGKHWVANIKRKDGRSFHADLGPVNEDRFADLGKGDQLVVRGPLLKAGDRQIMIVDEVERDGRSFVIDRETQKFSGEIAGTRTLKVRDEKHSMIIVATSPERKTLVDLGLASRLEKDLREGDRIQVWGVPVRVNDQRVVMAQKVEHDGGTSEIDRSPRSSSVTSADRDERERSKTRFDGERDYDERTARKDGIASQGQVTGNVLNKQKVTVRGNERQTVTIENKNGQRFLVDLGPAESAQATVRQGDRLRVSGQLVKAGNGKPVVLAKQIEINGRAADLKVGEGSDRARTTKTVSGTITDLQRSTVRNQQSQVAKVRTDDGTVTVDLGSPRYLAVELNTGDDLTASGVAVKSGEEVILLAREIEHNGDGTIAIRRPHRGSN